MILVIFQHNDVNMLDAMIQRTKLPIPFVNKKGQRSGNVLRIWREGFFIKGDVECVPDDAESDSPTATMFKMT